MIELSNVLCNKGNFQITIPELNIRNTPCINIIGPSGSGKSTLLKLMAGIEPLKSGTIKIKDINISAKNRNSFPKGVGYLSQDYGLWPNLTSIQHLALVRTNGANIKPTTFDREQLCNVGLDNEIDKKPFQLSEGQQQRLALIRALVASSTAILLDEPFSNSDMVTVKQLNSVINDACTPSSILRIQVIHDLRMLDKNDTVISINNGKVSEHGIWKEVIENNAKTNKNQWLKKAVELL